MRPLLLRPAVLFSGSVSAFSGLVLVISSKVDTDMPRRPGEVGLYVLTGITRSSVARGGWGLGVGGWGPKKRTGHHPIPHPQSPIPRAERASDSFEEVEPL